MNQPTSPLPRLPRPRPWVPTLLALAFAAVCLAPSFARARCMAGTFDAWPPPDTALGPQPMLLLEGFGNEQAPVAALEAGGSAHLVASGHRVALVVDAINRGAFGLTQAVVHTAEPLKPKTRYTLELRGADGEKARTTVWHDGKAQRVRWTTAAAGATPTPPRWKGEALVTGQSYQRFGCGPASHVDVQLPAESGALLAVQVELHRLDEEAPVETYVLPTTDGTLRIGHGMCSGAFRITGPERRYRAMLTLRDAAGRSVGEPRILEFDGVNPTGMFRDVQLR